MRRREFLGGAAAAFSLLPLAGCTAHSKPDAAWKPFVSDLETQIPQWMAEGSVPGLSIAVIQNAEMVWRRGFGVRDAESKDAVDDATVFEAQSMSKPVFAYVVMKLREKGVIDLDTPLTKYTPERFIEGDPRLDLITARHVLSHTTGFPNWRSKEEPLRINFAPGEKHSYSGEGYSYLQSVVTHLKGRVNPNECESFEADLRVCSTDIEDYMKANVLVPIGMTSSGYLWNETFERYAAWRHDEQGKLMKRTKPTGPSVARYASAGALRTTPTDYVKFVLAVLEPREGDPFRLNSASVAEMLHPQVKVNDTMEWALGWTILHTPNGDLFFHSGGIEGAHCIALASMQQKKGFVVMTNGQNGYKLIETLMKSDPIRKLL